MLPMLDGSWLVEMVEPLTECLNTCTVKQLIHFADVALYQQVKSR